MNLNSAGLAGTLAWRAVPAALAGALSVERLLITRAFPVITSEARRTRGAKLMMSGIGSALVTTVGPSGVMAPDPAPPAAPAPGASGGPDVATLAAHTLLLTLPAEAI